MQCVACVLFRSIFWSRFHSSLSAAGVPPRGALRKRMRLQLRSKQICASTREGGGANGINRPARRRVRGGEHPRWKPGRRKRRSVKRAANEEEEECGHGGSRSVIAGAQAGTDGRWEVPAGPPLLSGPRVSPTDGSLTKGLQAALLHTRLHLNAGASAAAAPAPLPPGCFTCGWSLSAGTSPRRFRQFGESVCVTFTAV